MSISIAALFLLFLLLRWFEYVQVFQPSVSMVSVATDAHQDARELQLLSGGRHPITAWWIPSLEKASYAEWLIIFSHGNQGNISHRQDFYRTWLHLGFNILAYDYQGYGKSQGKPSEQGSYQDLRTMVDWALANGYPKNRILLLGKSLGGGVAAEVAQDNQVAGLILHSTFTSILDVGLERFPALPVRALCSIRYETITKLPHIRLPVLILHSHDDSLIDYRHAVKNFSAATGSKWLKPVTGGHNESEWSRLPSLLKGVREFMDDMEAAIQQKH
ncbi:alpha/beta hydrolase [bacterium]|nr:alpha/beta hydrolase [bacterium]MDG1892106.1 alpha/beta hydrolase [Verrucomicrobiota bacterium]